MKSCITLIFMSIAEREEITFVIRMAFEGRGKR